MPEGKQDHRGLLLCNAMHITASVFINDDESGCTTISIGAGKTGPEKPIPNTIINTYEDNADAI